MAMGNIKIQTVANVLLMNMRNIKQTGAAFFLKSIAYIRGIYAFRYIEKKLIIINLDVDFAFLLL